MTELFLKMAEIMAITARVIKISIDGYENKRNCPFFSELVGMQLALKTMGIEYSYEYDDNYNISAVIVMGNRVEI